MNRRDLRRLDDLLDLVRRDPDVTAHVAGCAAAIRGWIKEQLNHRDRDGGR